MSRSLFVRHVPDLILHDLFLTSPLLVPVYLYPGLTVLFFTPEVGLRCPSPTSPTIELVSRSCHGPCIIPESVINRLLIYFLFIVGTSFGQSFEVKGFKQFQTSFQEFLYLLVPCYPMFFQFILRTENGSKGERPIHSMKMNHGEQ